MTKTRGIVLYSGGLDSLLAARILMEQGLDITGFHCILPFVSPGTDPRDLPAARRASQINLPLVFYRCGKEYMDMIKNPAHGYGKNYNPCIDCHIFFFRKAAEYMHETGASFLATGEVVGQRPMSQQKHMLNHIIKETGLQGRLLRPLSAKILKPTLVEEQGLVDRDRLFDISGRGRRRQMELAEQFGITEYESPAGGCLFTDANVARRIRDLMEHHEDYTPLDLFLTTVGRHVRLDDQVKILVSRNEKENVILEKHRDEADYFFEPLFSGPDIFVKGRPDEKEFPFITSVIARYGKPRDDAKEINIYQKGVFLKKILAGERVSDEILNRMRI